MFTSFFSEIATQSPFLFTGMQCIHNVMLFEQHNIRVLHKGFDECPTPVVKGSRDFFSHYMNLF